MLEEAGWRDTDDDGVRERNGQRLAFTLITQAGFAVRENVSQALQKMWRDVGVDAQVRLVDGTSISGLWFEGKFDAMLHWWHMPADPELTLFFAKDRMPPHGRNINYVEDDSLTRLLYASDRTVDQASEANTARGGAAADRRPGGRDPALQRDAAGCSTGEPRGLHGQSDERGHLLERPRVESPDALIAAEGATGA